MKAPIIDHRWRRPAAVILCALLVRGASEYGWLAWVALTPYALAFRSRGARAGAGLGLAQGTAIWLACTPWLAAGLMAWGRVAPATAWGFTLLFAFWQGAPYGAFGWASGWLARRGRPLGPGRAALWLAGLVALAPVIIPGHLAHTLFEYPRLTQVAELGGAGLLLFAVVLVNWLLADALAAWRRPGLAAGRAATAVLIVVAVAGYGTWRLAAFAPGNDPARQLDVALIQPDLPVERKSGAPPRGVADAAVLAREAAGRFPGAALILLPELPVWSSCGGQAPLDAAIAGAARAAGRPLLFGCVDSVYDPPRMEPMTVTGPDGKPEAQFREIRPLREFFNAAVVVGPDGAAGPVYRKVVLFPFGEYLPFANRFPLLRKLFPGVPGYAAGGAPMPLQAGGFRLAPLLCYEALSPSYVRAVAERADVLVHMADDAWFGDCHAARFHLALAAFRAVENRRPLLRVTNSGWSAIVQASGEIAPGSTTPCFAPAVREGRVDIRAGRSFYMRWGAFYPWLVGGLLLFDLLLALRRKPQVLPVPSGEGDAGVHPSGLWGGLGSK